MSVDRTTTHVGPGPLAGVRVLDLADEKGAYCGKLLADLGADVIKVEPPGGDPARSFRPFFRGRPSLNGSLYFWYHNTNKRSLILDLTDDVDRSAFWDLAANADVLLETFPVGHLARFGLDYGALSRRNPRLIQTSITPFGQTGPRAAWSGNDLTAWAMSGAMMTGGDPPRPPIRGAGGQSNYLASLHAFVATLAALRFQRRIGLGEMIDVSLQEVSIFQAEAVYIFYAYEGRFVERSGRATHAISVPCIAARTQDGGFCQVYVSSRAQWQSLVAWLEEEGLAGDFADERWLDKSLRLRCRDLVHQRVELLARRYGKHELFAEAQRRSLAFGPVLTPAEVAEDTGLAARGYFVPVDIGEDSPIRFPGAPYLFSETPWAIHSPAPHFPADPGQVAEQATSAPGAVTTWHPRPDADRDRPAPSITPGVVPPPGPRSPLAGVRILDFTWVVAGPWSTVLLADLGAEIIKVEVPGVGDPVRANLPVSPRGSPPNNSGQFNALNRGKRSLTLNLKHPQARVIARRLALACDVVVENFSPGTFERLIGDPEEWRREHPRLIVARLSGFGQTGPRRNAMAYAPPLHAISSFAYLTAYESTEPVSLGIAYSDYIGGFHGAGAILAALHHRDRTDRGQTIDVAQFEAMLGVVGPALLEYTANGEITAPAGNRLPERPDAPQGVYPCRPPTDPTEREAWLAVAITGDDHWTGLRAALGDPEWMRNPAYETAAGRAIAADQIDAAFSEWTSRQEVRAAMIHLQDHGIPAGAAQNGRDLLERDEHLAARGFWVTVDHPEVGPLQLPGRPFKLWSDAGSPSAGLRPPPLLGQDSESILRDLLGLSEDEMTRLILDEVI